MPTVFHSMKLDASDGMPLRGQSATTLGIRQSDFDIDPVTAMVAKPDPNDPDHGFLTPEVPMLLKDLEDTMEATRSHWQIV
jgi:hypothetical protein